MRYLSKRIEAVTVVEYSPKQEGKVFFGAWVELENDDGVVAIYRLVGADEIGVRAEYISIDSPMAKALIGKSVDDEVQVQTPEGPQQWFINAITYKATS